MKKQIVVAASGYMDPLHAGHIEALELAKKLGDKLIVIVNNDKQAILKKGYEFMPFKERVAIVKALRCVDEVFESIDTGRSVSKSLEAIKPDIFAKGGDRTSGEIPEGEVCRKYNIRIIDGLGKKIQSSSDLVKRAKEIEDNKAKNHTQ